MFNELNLMLTPREGVPLEMNLRLTPSEEVLLEMKIPQAKPHPFALAHQG